MNDTLPVPAAATVAPMGGLGAGMWVDRPTTEQLVARFLVSLGPATRVAYGRDLADWLGFLDGGQVEPLDATRWHVDLWAATLGPDGRGLAAGTVARKLSAVASFYAYAVSAELVARNPVALVKRPKVGSDSTSTGLDRDELSALLRAAAADGPRTEALLSLLAFNGLRVSEALGAQVEDLGSERGHRTLRIARKGGKRATLPLAPRTVHALDGYLDGRSTGPLFTTATGKALDRVAVWRTVRRLAATAVPSKAATLHPHDLRHAFVTLSLDAGADLRHVQDAAGHADPRTTRRYDRARHNLDAHPTHRLVSYVA